MVEKDVEIKDQKSSTLSRKIGLFTKDLTLSVSSIRPKVTNITIPDYIFLHYLCELHISRQYNQ